MKELVQTLAGVVFADGQFTHGEGPPSVDQGRGILPLPFYHESVFFQEKMEKSILNLMASYYPLMQMKKNNSLFS